MKIAFLVALTMFAFLGVKAQTTDSVTNKFNRIPYMPFDVFAKFPNGKFDDYIEKNIQYPAGQVQTINGESVIAFSIDRKGNLVKVQLLKNLSPTVDGEIIRLFNASPKWTPAQLKGNNVEVNIGMRLMVTTDTITKTITATEYKYSHKQIVADENSIYIAVSGPPEFPGGRDSLRRYLNRNIVYPAKKLQEHVGGSVILQFVIEKDGSLTAIKALRSPDDELAQEAQRVMQPVKYINGTQNGHPVRVQYSVEVKFDPDNPVNH